MNNHGNASGNGSDSGSINDNENSNGNGIKALKLSACSRPASSSSRKRQLKLTTTKIVTAENARKSTSSVGTPRVLVSAQERKRLILLSRRSSSSGSGKGKGSGGTPAGTNTSRRNTSSSTGTDNARDDFAGDAFAAGASAPVILPIASPPSSRSQPSSFNTNSNARHVNMNNDDGGDNESNYDCTYSTSSNMIASTSISASMSASTSISANTSQSQSLFADIGLQRQKLQQQKRRKKQHQHQHGRRRRCSYSNGNNSPNQQHHKQQKPKQNASLFGEIMKRTHLDQHSHSHRNEAAMEGKTDEGTGCHDDRINTEQQTLQQDTCVSYDNIDGSLKQQDINGRPIIPVFQRKKASSFSLLSSKAKALSAHKRPRRSNIFKQEKQPCTNIIHSRKRIDGESMYTDASESKRTRAITSSPPPSAAAAEAPLSLLYSPEISKTCSDNDNTTKPTNEALLPLLQQRYVNANDTAAHADAAKATWDSRSSLEGSHERNGENSNDDNDNYCTNDKADDSEIAMATTKKKIDEMDPNACPTSTFQSDAVNNARSMLYHREQHNSSPTGLSLKELLDKCMSPNPNPKLQLPLHAKNNANNGASSRIDGGLVEERRNSNNVTDAAAELVDDDNWQEAEIRLPEYVIPPQQIHNRSDEGITKSISKLSRGELNIIDWSIKKSLQIEYHPGRCIPGRPSSSTPQSKTQRTYAHIHDEYQIERQAVALLTNHFKLDTVQENPGHALQKEEGVLAQWRASLMYWQHPSNHPLPLSILCNSNDHDNGHTTSYRGTTGTGRKFSQSTTATRRNIVGASKVQPTALRTVGAFTNSSSRPAAVGDRKQRTSNQTTLNSSVYGPGAKLQRQLKTSTVGCLGGLGKSVGDSSDATVSSNASLLHRRELEWQECFRCLFHTWMSQIRQWNYGMKDGDSSADVSSRLYFYSVAPGTTILFRASPENTKKNEIKPTIVISSSTTEMRSMLRSMGTKLRILGGNRRREASGDTSNVLVDESFVSEWFRDDEMVPDSVDESLEQELEELRRAAFHGESAGAEVSFSHFRKKRAKVGHRKKASDFPPLLLVGKEDCMNFYEYFLNTCGGKVCKLPLWSKKRVQASSSQDNNVQVQDVPLLLCRSLGPMRYMALRQLSVHAGKGHNANASNDNQNENAKHAKSDSMVDIRGPILPCAVQDILCASVSHLCLDKKEQSSLLSKDVGAGDVDGKEMGESDKEESECGVGSHYFTMHLSTHDGEERNGNSSSTSSMKAFLGSTTSAAFNGFQNNHETKNDDDNDGDDEKNGFSVKECNTNEVMSMVVWDIDRPFGIAFKSCSHSIESSGNSFR